MTDPLHGLANIIEQANVRRAIDADRFRHHDRDECMLCDAHGADKRSLFIDCGYAVHEVVPEVMDVRDLELERGRGYYILICKTCRGRLLEALGAWADECRRLRGLPKDHDGDLLDQDEQRNIPIRKHGGIEWLTREEWDARHPGREPYLRADDHVAGPFGDEQ